MQVDIYIREKNGSREIRIPILPERFAFPGGEATFITTEIMGRGEVAVPSGQELATYSWESEFPGALRKNDPMIRGKWQDPKTYRSLLEEWKRKGIELNLLITGYPINMDVYCKDFQPDGEGAFGDIYYEVEFIEARHITVTTTVLETEKRPAASSNTYTIKSGDTLWGISLKFYGTGTKWKIIYEANKEIIEATAKKHGKSSSDNGHWIYPGVTLTIPNDSSSESSSSSSSDTEKKPSTKTYNKNYTQKRNTAIDALAHKLKGDTLKKAAMSTKD